MHRRRDGIWDNREWGGVGESKDKEGGGESKTRNTHVHSDTQGFMLKLKRLLSPPHEVWGYNHCFSERSMIAFSLAHKQEKE